MMIAPTPGGERLSAALPCQVRHIRSQFRFYEPSTTRVNGFPRPENLSLTRCPELPPSAVLWIRRQRKRLRKPAPHLLVRDEEV